MWLILVAVCICQGAQHVSDELSSLLASVTATSPLELAQQANSVACGSVLMYRRDEDTHVSFHSSLSLSLSLFLLLFLVTSLYFPFLPFLLLFFAFCLKNSRVFLIAFTFHSVRLSRLSFHPTTSLSLSLSYTHTHTHRHTHTHTHARTCAHI